MSQVQNVATGDFGHSLFSKNRQYAVASGVNFEGELGNGDRNSISTPTQINMDNVIDISAGAATYGGYSLFLKADSTLWASGNNANGALGNGTTVSQIIPIKVMTNVKSMSAGATHSLVLKNRRHSLGFGKMIMDNLAMERPQIIPCQCKSFFHHQLINPTPIGWLPVDPWPMFHHDVKHAGRAQ